jgi:hypothetical protein
LAAPLCVNKTYTYNAAVLTENLPTRRPLIHLLLRKPSNLSHKPSIKALYDTGPAVSLLTPADFELIKKYGVILNELEGKCKVQNTSQQPTTIYGTWRVCLFLNGRPMLAAFIVSLNRRNENHHAATPHSRSHLLQGGLQGGVVRGCCRTNAKRQMRQYCRCVCRPVQCVTLKAHH